MHLAKREPRPRTDCSDIPISLERVLKKYASQFSTIAVSLTTRYHEHDTKLLSKETRDASCQTFTLHRRCWDEFAQISRNMM